MEASALALSGGDDGPVQRELKRKGSFRDVLSDKDRRNSFMDFTCEGRDGKSSINFLIAVETFEGDEKTDRRRELGQHIMDTYVVESAPYKIDFDSWMVEKLLQDSVEGDYDPSLFTFTKTWLFELFSLGEFNSFFHAYSESRIKRTLTLRRYSHPVERSEKKGDGRDVHDFLFDVFRKECDHESGNWELTGAKKGVISYKKHTASNSTVSLGLGFVAETPEKLFSRISAVDESRTKWDSNFKSGKLLESIDDNSRVCYLRFHAPFAGLIKDRDFTILRCWRKFDDGTYASISTSIVLDKYPPVKGVIRAQMDISGYLIEHDGEYGSKVSYIADIDLKGDMPHLIREKISKLRPMVIHKISKIALSEPWV